MGCCLDIIITPPNPCAGSTPCKQFYPSQCVINEAPILCLGLGPNSTQAQINAAICSVIGDCCTPPQTYTINSICNGDPPGSASTLTFTPNFTYIYPLIVTMFISYDNGAHWVILGYSFPITGTVAGVPISVTPADIDPPHGSVDFSGLSDAIIKLIDNQSNYSATFQIPNPIATC